MPSLIKTNTLVLINEGIIHIYALFYWLNLVFKNNRLFIKPIFN